jgi:drug/metabolite transporter (DMT)-like permease
VKTAWLLLSLIACSSLGEVLSAKGMQQVGAVSLRPRALLQAIGRMLRNPYLFVGVIFLAVSFFSFISLLSYADLSLVVPLTAVSYVTNTLGAKFFLGEQVEPKRWLGTLLVMTGVIIISLAAIKN